MADDQTRQALEAAAVHVRLGQFDEALVRLAEVEQVEPDNPWMWYYRGSAFTGRGDHYEALRAFDQASSVLSDLGGDEELSGLILSARTKTRRNVFNFSVSMGLGYDSNVSFLGGGSSDLGFVAGQGNGTFDSSAQIDFAPIATKDQTLAAGFRTSQLRNFQIEQFDLQNYGAYLRYSRRFGSNWEASIRYDYDVSLLNNESFLSNHALSTSLGYHWTRYGSWFRLDTTRVFYRFEARDFLFETDPDLDRDGTAHFVGIEQSFDIQPIADFAWVWDVSAAYQFGRIATEGDEFDRRTHDFLLALDMPLVNPKEPEEFLLIPDRELRFRFDARWQIANYRNPSAFDRRRDVRDDLITDYGFTRFSMIPRMDRLYCGH
ncbi:MAG: hypothetical protein GXP29_08790 [Planctomycetes bacterium]|nr:hypothetical protein [Planctomycetota bacterium]